MSTLESLLNFQKCVGNTVKSYHARKKFDSKALAMPSSYDLTKQLIREGLNLMGTLQKNCQIFVI